MKRRSAPFYLTLGVVLIGVLCSCGAHRNYAYLGDAPRDTELEISTTYQSLIYPGDQLYIYVNSQLPELVAPFNEETNKLSYNKSTQTRGYLVNDDGDIVYPVIGKIHAAGLSREAFGHLIEAKLIEGRYVPDPVVSVSLMNYRVAVVGEVATPSVVTTVGDRLTIFEALAYCGDITMDGLRGCVSVIRTQGDMVLVDTLDLTSAEVLNSPFYYLQQNDVVYVHPTKRKKRIAYRNEDWPTYVAISVGVLRTAYVFVYRYIINTEWMNR